VPVEEIHVMVHRLRWRGFDIVTIRGANRPTAYQLVLTDTSYGGHA
jgi:hypothetical protein